MGKLAFSFVGHGKFFLYECCTGFAVMPCSALSQASCRSPDDGGGGAGLLPKDEWEHVCLTLCEQPLFKLQ